MAARRCGSARPGPARQGRCSGRRARGARGPPPGGAGGQPGIAGSAGAGSNCARRPSEKGDAGIRFDFGVTSTRTDVRN
ncbi:hypothetical protein FS722_16955, partial [Pseudomonas aeruginosa]